MMILHNIKVAWRNLMKYRIQNIVSIVALAVGIVTLSATHFVLKHMGPPSIAKESYYDRCYVMCLYDEKMTVGNGSAPDAELVLDFLNNSITVTPEMESALKAGGALPGVEKMLHNHFVGGLMRGSDMTFTMPDSTTRTRPSNFFAVEGEKLNFHAIRSALTGEKVPVWISEYVLAGYGTGAIMAVPAHDERDYDFAKKFGIDIIEVIKGGDIEKEAYTGDGEMVNSEFLNGIQTKKEAIAKMLEFLAGKGVGEKGVQYKMKDWAFNRQRYWGEPIPIVHCEKCGIVGVPYEELPLRLPPMENFEPGQGGESPLAKLDYYVNCNCPKCGAKVIYKANWLRSQIEDKAKICVADRSVNNELLLRWVDVSRKYSWPDYKRKYGFTTNAYNLYLRNGKVYFYKWLCAAYSYGYYWYRGRIGDQCYDNAYIYTDNLNEVFGPKYYNVDLKAGLAGKHSQICFNSLLNNLKNHPVAEYLFKMGMPSLASEAGRLIGVEGTRFSDIMGIRAEYAQVYREADVTYQEHRLIRCAQSWVSADMIQKFRTLHISENQNHLPGGMLANMSFEKMVNYFSRQASVCKRTAAFCMEQWNDYIYMCRTQNIDVSSKSIKFPKNIVEAHDALALKVTAIKNAELDEAYAAASDDSYRRLNATPYTKGPFSIVLSHSATELVAEGQALGHCVGNGSYAKRVISGNILILFVRMADAPEKPYATLEYSIGTRQILQLYGKGNKPVSSECRRFVEGYLRSLTCGNARKEKRA